MPRLNTQPALERFILQIDFQPDDGCWLWTGSTRRSQAGIPYGRFWVDRETGIVPTHRYALVTLGGAELPDAALACHHCDTPLCVRPSHLYAGTVATNAQDRDTRQRRDRRSGERHHFAHLTRAQVAEIRAEYAAGGSGQRGRRGTVTYGELAQRCGVTDRTIGKIIRSERWRD